MTMMMMQMVVAFFSAAMLFLQQRVDVALDSVRLFCLTWFYLPPGITDFALCFLSPAICGLLVRALPLSLARFDSKALLHLRHDEHDDELLVASTDCATDSLPASTASSAAATTAGTTAPSNSTTSGATAAAATLRHSVAAASGAALLCVGFGWKAVLVVLLPTLAAHAAMRACRKHAGVVFTWGMFGFLLACHTYFGLDEKNKWTNESAGFEMAGVLMTLTLKLSSICFDFSDGIRPHDSLTAWQRKNRVTQLPSLLQLCSFSFAFGPFLLGPLITFRDFCCWVEQKEEWKECPSIFSLATLSAFVRAMLKFLICMHIFAILHILYEEEGVDDPTFWFSKSFKWRAIMVYLGVTRTRFQYYFIWALSEATLVVSGAGFTGWQEVQVAAGREKADMRSSQARSSGAGGQGKEKCEGAGHYMERLDASGATSVDADSGIVINRSWSSVMNGECVLGKRSKARMEAAEEVVGKGEGREGIVDGMVEEDGKRRNVAEDAARGVENDKGRSGGSRTRRIATWTNAKNGNILQIELPNSAARFVTSWNIQMSTWLRHYVYDRIAGPKGRLSLLQLLFTEVVCALWHGFDLGYLMFCCGLALVVKASRVIYLVQRATPPRSLKRFALNLVHGAYAVICINYVGMGFVLSKGQKTLRVWHGTYYIGNIVPLTILLVAFMMKPLTDKERTTRPSTSVNIITQLLKILQGGKSMFLSLQRRMAKNLKL